MNEEGAAAHPPVAGAAGQAAADQGVALSRAQAERVISRALELAEPGAAPDEPVLTLAQVQDIAAQVGVDREVVRRALADVRLAELSEHRTRRAEALLGPDAVTGARHVPASPDAVRVAVARWMADDEGMARVGVRGEAERWTKDGRLLVSLQRSLGSQRGGGVLRDLRAVTVTVAEEGADADATPVVLEADTTTIRQAGAAVAVGGAVLSAALGALTAGVLPDTASIGPDALQAAAAAVPALIATAVTAVAVTRTWTGRVREAVEQALDGIAMSTAGGDHLPALPAPDDGWRGSLLRWLGGSGG